jgi:hypothetical protein
MKTKVFALAIALNLFEVAPMWPQQKSPDANLLAQLEKSLAQSDSESKRLTAARGQGKPKAVDMPGAGGVKSPAPCSRSKPQWGVTQ